MSNDTLGPLRTGRRTARAVVSDAKRDDEAAAARRRVASARRPSAGRRAPIDDGVSRASCRYQVLKHLFAASDDTIAQTDIVMLLTPRIIRTHEYTARDLSPIYVGTNQNFGLTGPPPLIAAPPVEPDTAPAPGAAAPAPVVPPQGLPVPTAPQGGTPGQVTTPAPQAPLQPPAPLQPQAQAAPPADPQAQRDLTAPRRRRSRRPRRSR